MRAAVLRQEALAYAAIIRRNWRPLRKCAAVAVTAATATQTLFVSINNWQLGEAKI